ncbi:MAG: hypothetical protein AAEJ52_13030 [Myxococcota bacterium]
MTDSSRSAETAPCFGYCRDCGTTHRLPAGNARAHARELMREFQQIRRLDYLVSDDQADPRLCFEQLFPGERGHMFGVLECRDDRGCTVVLRAFSSLRGGIRDVDGWVSPILSPESFYGIVLPGIEEIQEATRELDGLAAGSPSAADLTLERTRLSQDLWRNMEALYSFQNFRTESRSLRDAFFSFLEGEARIPAGTGECCAPKLLNHAARNGLTPVGLAEFYWGGTNQSGGRKPGHFYPCCETRCQPIMGFMLCGLAHES